MLVRFFCAWRDATVVDLPCCHWIDGREERSWPASLLIYLFIYFNYFSFFFFIYFCSLPLPPTIIHPWHSHGAAQINPKGCPGLASPREDAVPWVDEGAAATSGALLLGHQPRGWATMVLWGQFPCRRAAGVKGTSGPAVIVYGEQRRWEEEAVWGWASSEGVLTCSVLMVFVPQKAGHLVNN